MTFIFGIDVRFGVVVSTGRLWPGQGSEDVNLRANNRSFGKVRGYSNYLNWIVTSTGRLWPEADFGERARKLTFGKLLELNGNLPKAMMNWCYRPSGSQ